MKVAILFSLLLAGAFANANGERQQYYTGVRQMGMGGASVATVNDETALISNPAGLGKLRDAFITIIDPDLEFSSQTANIVKYDALKMTDPQQVLDKAHLHQDQNLHEKVQIFPSLVVPNFGIGIFGKYNVSGMDNSSTGKFDFDYTNDYALVMGVNFRLWNGIIKVGTNARIDNRTEVHNSTIDDTSTNLTLQSLANSGVGIGSDAGIMLTAPVAYLPTLAAVYRDVGRTNYTMRDGLFMTTTNKPDSTPPTLDGALSIQPILGKRVRSTWTVQLDDTMNAYKEKDINRRIHGGVEFNFADAIFVRGGYNQRYWTAGLELAMGNYQFQAASYGEDIGPDGSPKEDRRYEVKFAFRF